MSNLENFRNWERILRSFKVNSDLIRCGNTYQFNFKIITEKQEDWEKLQELVNNEILEYLDEGVNQKLKKIINEKLKEYQGKVLRELGVWDE